MSDPSKTAAEILPLPPWPVFDEDMVEDAAAVLRSGKVNYWTNDIGRRFEEELAAWAGCRHGVAVANGTLALELALSALGVGAGDEVVTTCRTFLASASAAVMRGATPVLADVDRDSENISAETIERCLSPRTKAIIAVHLWGWPCEMDEIMELAEARGIKVIEDCAQAHGARYRGRPVGSLGHVAAWSFCQDKIITTGGEGGMLTTSSKEIWEKSWSFKDHGKSWERVYEAEHPPGYRWLHESFGTNWRLTEMQSAIGRAALRKLGGWTRARVRNASILSERFSDLPALRVARPPEHVDHARYKYSAFVRPSRLKQGWDRDRIMAEIGRRGVPCGSGICGEIYREGAFKSSSLGPAERLPMARELAETSLNFLVHPTLEPEHMEMVAGVAAEVLAEATR
jgi:dTDP-4-amino-4,6-dideoxygalactose transaminase